MKAGILIRLAVAVAAVLCVAATASDACARPKLRGMVLGEVAGFDEDKQLVMVDIGAKEGVLRGIGFVVVDERGNEVAKIVADEVFEDLFWSAELGRNEFRRVQYGMQVRWLFTPESSTLVAARKKGTPEAYRNYLEMYPKGKLVHEFVKVMDPGMMQELDPEFYAAWKEYSAAALDAYAEVHSGTALAEAASAEAAVIKEYEKAQKEEQIKREKSAGTQGGASADRPVTFRGGTDAEPFEVMYRGELVNDSSQRVTFEFDSPGRLGKTPVEPYGRRDVMHRAGTFTYRVYGEKDEFGGIDAGGGFGTQDGFGADDDVFRDAFPEDRTAVQQPLKVDTVTIDFDMWEITYP